MKLQCLFFLLFSFVLMTNCHGYWDFNQNYDSDFQPNYHGFRNPGDYVKSIIAKKIKDKYPHGPFSHHFDQESESESSSSNDYEDYYDYGYDYSEPSYENDYYYRGNSGNYGHSNFGRYGGNFRRHGIRNNPFFGNYFPF